MRDHDPPAYLMAQAQYFREECSRCRRAERDRETAPEMGDWILSWETGLIYWITVQKRTGMLMLLRTMTPEILAADEIGGERGYEGIGLC